MGGTSKATPLKAVSLKVSVNNPMSFFLVCPELDFTLEFELRPAVDSQVQR